MWKPEVGCFLGVLLFASAVTSVDWSEELRDGDPVYVCAGENLLLPWNVSESSEKEGIEDIQWFFHGRSQEMIAMYADGNFLATASFSNRVQHVGQGGLLLKTVDVADTGNYSIEVSGYNDSGVFFTLRRTAVVRVGDSLMTTDGNLHIKEEIKATWDDSDQQFHVVLSCGTFTYLTYPPFELEWTMPDDSKQNSSRYLDGQFQLLLDNPVTGGNYSCRIPLHSAATACLPGNTPKPVLAGRPVDSMAARLTVLEAQQVALQAENGRLKGDNNLLQMEVESLQTQLEDYINETSWTHVSFHATISSSHRSVNSGRTIVLPTIEHNEGNAYNSSTGQFTAPFNATYFFAATTSSPSSTYNGRANAQIMVDGTAICTIQSSVNHEVGSCQAVTYLTAGQEVWLQSYDGTNYFSSPTTAFIGFLVSQ